MAQWYGTARSNYFQVKDLQAFKDALKDIAIEVLEGTGDHLGEVAIFGADEYGGFPSSYWIEDSDESIDIDLVDLIAPHLQDGWVCVLQEVGAEKQRYVTGHSVAFNNHGEFSTVNIDDIYTIARRDLGEHCTVASY